MWEILKTASLEEIFRFGVYLFLLYMVYWFIKKMWGLLEGKINNIYDNTTDNKKLNKDIAVIIAQTLTKVEKHDQMSSEAWGKVLTGFDRICDFLNGKNPAIAKIKAELQAEMKELEKKIK